MINWPIVKKYKELVAKAEECDRLLKKLATALVNDDECELKELANRGLTLNEMSMQLVRIDCKIRECLAEELKQALSEFNLEKAKHLYRGRRFYSDLITRMYYEPCPIVQITSKKVICTSSSIPGMRRGGTFQINKEKLLNYGHAYHSKCAEEFYIIPLADASPLPGMVVMGGKDRQPRFDDAVLGSK